MPTNISRGLRSSVVCSRRTCASKPASASNRSHTAPEHPCAVRLMHDSHRTVRVTKEECVLGQDQVVGRIGIPGPVEKSHAASVSTVRTAGMAARLEGLGGVVGNEQRDAPRTAVHVNRPDRFSQVLLAGHVIDCIVDEHRIEAAVKPQSARVGMMVLALGIEHPRDRKHLLGEVDERHGEMALEVDGVVAARTAQLKYLTYGYRGRLEHRNRGSGLLFVLLRRRDQRPPNREFPVYALFAHGG